MSVDVDLRVLELVCARLCHELVSPVAAINNGVELLGEDDPDFVKDAIALLGQSARKAGQRLQFYRFAYGGSAGSAAAVDCRELAQGLLDGGKIRCDWPVEAADLPGDWRKLAVNLVVLAADALPRGGTVSVRRLGPGQSGIAVIAEGATVNFTDETRAALESKEIEALSSRSVHAYVTARLAERLGVRLTLALAPPGKLTLTAGG